MKKILLTLSFLLLLCGCGEQTIICEEADMTGYHNLSEKDYSHFKAIKLEGLQDLFENKKSAYIYLGYTGCPHCQQLVKELVKINKNITFYYLDAMYVIEKPETYNEITNLLNDALEKNEEGEKVVQAPEVIKIINGEISDYYLGFEEGDENDLAQYTKVLKGE